MKLPIVAAISSLLVLLTATPCISFRGDARSLGSSPGPKKAGAPVQETAVSTLSSNTIEAKSVQGIKLYENAAEEISMLMDLSSKKKAATEYWSDQRIHTLGNTGFLGAFHAAVATLSTKVIDDLAYRGMDVRGKVSARNAVNRMSITIFFLTL